MWVCARECSYLRWSETADAPGDWKQPDVGPEAPVGVLCENITSA